MTRTARIDIVGGIYRVMTRGIERRAIFKDDTDRKGFLIRLSEELVTTKSQCYGWVLMPTNVEGSEHKRMRLGHDGWTIESLAKKVCALMNVDYREIKGRSYKTKLSATRSLLAYWEKTELGLRVSAIAEYFGVSSPSVSELIRRGELLVRKSNLNLPN